ncbi:AraC family transcriptional regulator ligand-binding domain-containing protein [Pseudomonas fluorescens]|uniref:helix-turn-helix transcriptional regulator n=1 Tax=Pseudomonas fluorescens TaxID=294 RepID=UPI003C1CF430
MKIVNHWPTNRFPAHRNRPSLCVGIINSGVLELEARGVDMQRLQSDWGVSLASLRQPHLRLPAFLARRFWEVARDLSDDPAIGLAAARQNDPGQMLGLAYLMQLMPSRMQSLDMLARYWPLWTGHMSLLGEVKDGLLHVALMPEHALQPAVEELDFWGALQIQHLKGLPGTTNAVREIHFRRSRPENPEPWLKLAAGEVRFDAARNEVVLDMAALGEPRPGGSPAICKALEAALKSYAEQTARESVFEAVANAVLADLAQPPGLEQMAEHLHLTSRTLHRALHREGWTFNAIVEIHRRYVAHDLLSSGKLSVSEVAEQLGYREVSNFSRAFRRWYGVSPSKLHEH